VVRQLKKDFPIAECALEFETPFQLLIATILSAQCTDVRVNIVTRDLFAKYSTPQQMATATQLKLEKIIQTTGFFRNKAKNILGAAQAICDQHDGQVPQKLEQLVKLPGVGRKTANVVLGTAFDIPSGIVVDTHVTRLCGRLGLVEGKDAVKIENQLLPIIPKREWIGFSHRLIYHGRQVCNARKPKCDSCNMSKFCPRLGVAVK